MSKSELKTPNDLVEQLSEKMTAAAQDVLSGASFEVLSDLRAAIFVDGAGDVLSTIQEIVPGILGGAIDNAERARILEEADHAIDVSGPTMQYICRMMGRYGARYAMPEQKNGRAFVVDVEGDRYAFCTDSRVILASRTMLPEGEYVTDGKVMVYAKKLPYAHRRTAALIVPASIGAGRPKIWTQNGTGEQFVTWDMRAAGATDCPRFYTILGAQFDVALAGGDGEWGFADHGEHGWTLALVDKDRGRFAAIAQYIVAPPADLFGDSECGS